MKLHLIHFSPGGTTRRTVKNIASGIALKEVKEYNMLKVDVRNRKYTFNHDDLLVIGMPTPTKSFGLPNEILDALKGNNTPFVGVVTYGNGCYGSALIMLKKAMEERGFKMVAGGAFVGQYSFDERIARGRPDEIDSEVQKRFGEKIYDKVVINNDLSFHEKLRINWPKEGMASTVISAIRAVTPGIEAKLAKSASTFEVTDDCIKCKACIKHCPVGAVSLHEKIEFNKDLCIGCQGCLNICPKKAIKQVNTLMIKGTESLVSKRQDRKEADLFI